MQVRILKSIATAGRAYAPGQIIDIDDELALAWIGAGVAEKPPKKGPASNKGSKGPTEVKQDDPATDNAAGDGAGDSGGSESLPEDRPGRRKRGNRKSD